MEILKFKSINELINTAESWSHSCEKCKSLNEMDEYETKFIIGIYEIIFDKIPLLKCTSCGEINVPPFTIGMVNYVYSEMVNRCIYNHSVKSSNYHEKYDYCKKISLVYSHHDYECIPGLKSSSEDGFLVPVYFNRKILSILMHLPEYQVDWFSEGYGCISKNDEWHHIVFGINSNGKVVMWLGDLDCLDEETQRYFEINNVDSDHKLIDSDFYRAQMLSLWSQPKRDRFVFTNRNKFYDNVMKKYSINLYHLKKECDEKRKTFNSPVLYSDSEMKNSIEILHQYCIEGISIKELKKLYFQLDSTKTPQDVNDLKSIKLLQLVFELQYSALDTSSFLSPLYLLNDLRIIFCHLLSDEEIIKLKENLLRTLSIVTFDNRLIYDSLIERLNKLYTYFAQANE